VQPAIEVIWYFGKRIIRTNFYQNMSRLELKIRASEEYDRTVCILQNKYGTAAYFFQLILLEPLRFLMPLREHMFIHLGDNVTLTIYITNNLLVDIRWYYNHHLIANRSIEQYVAQDSAVSSLIIGNFSLSDAGDYRVIVKNNYNMISSKTTLHLKSSK